MSQHTIPDPREHGVACHAQSSEQRKDEQIEKEEHKGEQLHELRVAAVRKVIKEYAY